MVGGGPDAFIGAVHRMAMRLDGSWELVAGAFSSNAEKSSRMGAELGLAPDRVHGSYADLAAAEAARPADERAEVGVVVTPNHLHHPVAKTLLEHGMHVVCDKPLTTTLEHAEDLCRLSAEHDRLFAVTYNYTGYPMVKEARARVASGALGALRKVVVEYSQGWLRTLLEAEGQKQAEWRADPERAGISSALGDIGSHAYDVVRYVTGLGARRIFADLGTVVAGRVLEDDATVLLELDGGVRCVMLVSQISTGERNHLRLRVYGADGGLDWCQEDPERLRMTEPDGSERILYRGGEGLSVAAGGATRLPGGHPEGFIEAFGNIYGAVATAILESGEHGGVWNGARTDDYPTVHDGARGVHFIHRAVESHGLGAWVDAAYDPPGAET